MDLQKGMKVLIHGRLFEIMGVSNGSSYDCGIEFIYIGPVTVENVEFIRTVYGGSSISTKGPHDPKNWREEEKDHIKLFGDILDKDDEVTITNQPNKTYTNILERYDN